MVRLEHDILVSNQRFLEDFGCNLAALQLDCDVKEINRAQRLLRFPSEDPEGFSIVFEVLPHVRGSVFDPDSKHVVNGSLEYKEV